MRPATDPREMTVAELCGKITRTVESLSAARTRTGRRIEHHLALVEDRAAPDHEIERGARLLARMQRHPAMGGKS